MRNKTFLKIIAIVFFLVMITSAIIGTYDVSIPVSQMNSADWKLIAVTFIFLGAIPGFFLYHAEERPKQQIIS